MWKISSKIDEEKSYKLLRVTAKPKWILHNEITPK